MSGISADIAALAKEMRANSERWFPRWHSPELGMPLRVAYALGLAGEVGEVANVVKKIQRDGDSGEKRADLAAELADCFTYLLLLADECDVDIVAEYRAKVSVNETRWGQPRGWNQCPGYQGVPTYGGPCWTCQNGRGPCPLNAAPHASASW